MNIDENKTNIQEEIVYKKRGRKPKGGKIIKESSTIQTENSIAKIEYKPNIILHLKCHLHELHELNESDKLDESKNIPEISTFYNLENEIVDVPTFSYSNILSDFTIQQSQQQPSFYSKDYKPIYNDNTDFFQGNSYGDDLKCNDENSNSKLSYTIIDINDNITTKKKSMFHKEKTKEKMIKKNDETDCITNTYNNLLNLNKKIKIQEQNMHSNNWKKTSACFWCT